MIARRFYRNEHRIFKRFEKQKESTQERNKRDLRGVKCYECSGYGHVRKDCANLKSNKPKDQKTFNITLNDTNEEETPNYIAFVASYYSDDSTQSNVKSTSDNESKRVNDLQNSFNNLMKKFSMLKNINLKIVKDVKNLELEKDNLLKTLSDSHSVCNTLKSENHVLIAKNTSIQNDLIETRNHLSTFFSEKLNKMLHVQKRSSDRSGLGYDKTASLSSNCAYTLEIVFGKLVKVEEFSGEGKQVVTLTLQGKKISIEPHASYLSLKSCIFLGNYLLKGLSLHVIIVKKLVTFDLTTLI